MAKHKTRIVVGIFNVLQDLNYQRLDVGVVKYLALAEMFRAVRPVALQLKREHSAMIQRFGRQDPKNPGQWFVPDSAPTDMPEDERAKLANNFAEFKVALDELNAREFEFDLVTIRPDEIGSKNQLDMALILDLQDVGILEKATLVPPAQGRW